MDNSLVSHTLSYLIAGGFLGLAFATGKLYQKVNQHSEWIETHNKVFEKNFDVLQEVQKDIAVMRKEIEIFSDRLDRLYKKILGETR